MDAPTTPEEVLRMIRETHREVLDLSERQERIERMLALPEQAVAAEERGRAVKEAAAASIRKRRELET